MSSASTHAADEQVLITLVRDHVRKLVGRNKTDPVLWRDHHSSKTTPTLALAGFKEVLAPAPLSLSTLIALSKFRRAFVAEPPPSDSRAS